MLQVAELEDFYRVNFHNLVKKISRRAGSPQNAEDVVQEAFTRCLTYKDTFHNGAVFSTWFNRVMNNSLKDLQRAERMLGMTIEYKEDDAEPIEMSQTAVHEVRRVQELLALRTGLDHKILVMYLVLGYKPREIVQAHPSLCNQYVRTLVMNFRGECQVA